MISIVAIEILFGNEVIVKDLSDRQFALIMHYSCAVFFED